MKILIVTPRSPFQGRGADEQDRLSGIRWFVERGFSVKVITKSLPNDLPYIKEAERKLSIEIVPISYKFLGKKHWWKRILVPKHWDGAAYEYFEKEIQNEFVKSIEGFKPDLIWFDYTYLWPLYRHAHSKKIPIITRSINFEPTHFLDEDGNSFLNKIRSFPKIQSEKKALNGSSWFFAITPKEEEIYKRINYKNVPIRTLPLRGLPNFLGKRKPNTHEGIKIGFMASTYSVHHNREALRFILEDIWTSIPEHILEKVTLHFTGNKIPDKIIKNLPKGVFYEGFVPDSIDFWNKMDIALVPSVFGAGMQQKIFEPLALGVPTITSSRGLVGYPFVCGEHLFCAKDKEGFVLRLSILIENQSERVRISDNSKSLSEGLFVVEKRDFLMKELLENI